MSSFTPLNTGTGVATPLPFIAKYKPYYIRDFCMDSKLSLFLSTLLKMDDINVLLAGNPNTGKTTMLYAIIREYYALKKMEPIPEKNILFINNLKEQGISYFRTEMKNFCQTYSTIPGKKKMIIIDDIDFINEQCQQIFRNYIDKYKHNIHFISVCSNIQKVIESLQSRLHILYMAPPSKEQVESIVERIIGNEQISISPEAKAYLIATHNYSTRALINHLEKIALMGAVCTERELSLEQCKQMCSNLSLQQFETYIAALRESDLTRAIQILYRIVEEGYSVIDILDFFFSFVKTTDLLSEDEKYRMIPYLCKYIYYFHNIHEEPIELALITNELLRLM
jgi:DNA polymerase III delta prime subunit